MKRSAMCVVFSVGASLLAVARPMVTQVDASQVWVGKPLKVAYSFSGGPAVITADVLTNGVSVGAECLLAVSGDVNRVVSQGAGKFTWQAPESWRGMRESNVFISAVVTAWELDAPPDYMVVDLTGKKTVEYYESEGLLPLGVDSDAYRTEKMVFRRIHAAGRTFRFGPNLREAGRDTTTHSGNLEAPRLVQFSSDYYLGIFEVTQDQCRRILGYCNALFKNADCKATRPVENIVYADEMFKSGAWPNADPAAARASDDYKFFGKMRSKTALSDWRVSLPTEAQWEYACRAGAITAYYDGSSMATNENGVCEALNALARYSANGGLVDGETPDYETVTTDHGTARVGSYKPNAWGLYDMLGNVAEMCHDYCYDIGYMDRTSVALDPVGHTKDLYNGTAERVVRGGAWNWSAAKCRSASRANYQMWTKNVSTGFRVCYNLGE